jgi:hypothetical protein
MHLLYSDTLALCKVPLSLLYYVKIPTKFPFFAILSVTKYCSLRQTLLGNGVVNTWRTFILFLDAEIL